LAPQHWTEPPLNTAQVWEPPAAIAIGAAEPVDSKEKDKKRLINRALKFMRCIDFLLNFYKPSGRNDNPTLLIQKNAVPCGAIDDVVKTADGLLAGKAVIRAIPESAWHTPGCA